MCHAWKKGVDKVFKVLCSICWAKVLIINEKIIKALSKEGSMPTSIFGNMCNLSIHCESLNADLVPGTVSLLRGMPILKILFIKTSSSLHYPKTPTGFGIEYWKLQNLDFIIQLEVVTIENSHGSNEIVFARYILEHAQNLKKLVIDFHDEDEQLKVVAGMVSKARSFPLPQFTFGTQRQRNNLRSDSEFFEQRVLLDLKERMFDILRELYVCP